MQHEHSFGQEKRRPGERRTIVVIAITAAMMVVEIAAGVAFGSMALLADGLHMASHAAALTVSAFAYVYARRHAHDARYSFGTGKINALGGYTGGILLAIFAALMAWESVLRLFRPVDIAFNQAITVAAVGLIVNGVSVFILDESRDHHAHESGHHHDHNLRAAYLHVAADALTSFLAIFALLAAKYIGLVWMDPLVGVVGAAIVARWSLGLLRNTSGVLLDRQGPEEVCDAIRGSVEDGGGLVTDLHLWAIGPGIYGAIVSIVAPRSLATEHFMSRMPAGLDLAHVTVEVCAPSDRPMDGSGQF